MHISLVPWTDLNYRGFLAHHNADLNSCRLRGYDKEKMEIVGRSRTNRRVQLPTKRHAFEGRLQL